MAKYNAKAHQGQRYTKFLIILGTLRQIIIYTSAGVAFLHTSNVLFCKSPCIPNDLDLESIQPLLFLMCLTCVQPNR